MVLDAAEHVPFYRRHWAKAGVDLTRIYSAVHLEFLPVVRREDLLACAPEDCLDRRFLGQEMHAEPTSGATSGEPFEMPVDKRSLRRRRKRFLSALRDVGYSPVERVMLIAEPPFPAGAALMRWSYVDLRLGEEAIFTRFVKTRPHVLHGPLSSLTLLARRLHATPGVTWRPRVVVSTGEPLSDSRRALLESAFRAKVADFYALSEFGLVAYSKPGFPGYQVLTDEFHVELLTATPGKRGELERLIVTDLLPGALPLIRFETGDLVHRDASRGLGTAGAPTSALASAPIVAFSGRAGASDRDDIVLPPLNVRPLGEEAEAALPFDRSRVVIAQAMA
jgi:phenylacetate-coenzyme A ligase PaaK-like adenylate-forming protein